MLDGQAAGVVFHAYDGEIRGGDFQVLQGDGVVAAVEDDLEGFGRAGITAVCDAFPLDDHAGGADLLREDCAGISAHRIQVIPQRINRVVGEIRVWQRLIVRIRVVRRVKRNVPIAVHVHLRVRVAKKLEREADVHQAIRIIVRGHHRTARGNIHPIHGYRRAVVDGVFNHLLLWREVNGRAIRDDPILVVCHLNAIVTGGILHTHGGTARVGHIQVLQRDAVVTAIQQHLERLRETGVATVRDPLPLHNRQRGADLLHVDDAIIAANGVEIIPEGIDGVIRITHAGDGTIATVIVGRAKRDVPVGIDVHLCVAIAVEFKGEADVHQRGCVISDGHNRAFRGDVHPVQGDRGVVVVDVGDGLLLWREVNGRAIGDHAVLVINNLDAVVAVGIFHADGGAARVGYIQILQRDAVVRAVQQHLERFRRAGVAAVHHSFPLHDGERGADLLHVYVAVVAADGVEVIPEGINGIVRIAHAGDWPVAACVIGGAKHDVPIGVHVHLRIGVAIEREGETDVYQRGCVVGDGDDHAVPGYVHPVEGHIRGVVHDLIDNCLPRIQLKGHIVVNHARFVVSDLHAEGAGDVFYAYRGAVREGHVQILQGDAVIAAVQDDLEGFRGTGVAAVAHLLPLHHRARGVDLLHKHAAVIAANGVEVIPKGVNGVVWRCQAGDGAVGVVGVARAKADEAVGADVHLRVGVVIECEREANVHQRVGVVGRGHDCAAGGNVNPVNGHDLALVGRLR